jgi:hypothetical protein
MQMPTHDIYHCIPIEPGGGGALDIVIKHGVVHVILALLFQS